MQTKNLPYREYNNLLHNELNNQIIIITKLK